MRPPFSIALTALFFGLVATDVGSWHIFPPFAWQSAGFLLGFFFELFSEERRPMKYNHKLLLSMSHGMLVLLSTTLVTHAVH